MNIAGLQELLNLCTKLAKNFQLPVYSLIKNAQVSDELQETKALYCDDYGNLTTDPYKVTGRNMGEPNFLTPTQIYSVLKLFVTQEYLIDKQYSLDFMCTDFVCEALGLLGINSDNFMPSRSVVISISMLDNDLILPEKGKNPDGGLYVFYKKYDDQKTGHTGFILFGDNGNATILHNGSDGKGSYNVNERTRDNRDFNTWFSSDRKYEVKYKWINLER